MEYIIFSVAALLLAIGLCRYDPHTKGRSGTDNHPLSLLGLAAHVGGAVTIGWMDGLALGLLAFLAIPLFAYLFHSVVILPVLRTRRLRGRHRHWFTGSLGAGRK